MFARLFASLLAGEASSFVGRLRMAAVFYLLAGAAALCGVIFLIGAGYIAAAQRWGALDAAIWFGVGFLVLSAVIWIIHKITARAQVRRAERRRSSDLRALGATAAVALLPSLLARKGLGTLLLPLAAVAAYMIYEENSGASEEDDLEDDED